MDRRAFLRATMAGGAAAGLGWPIAGCAPRPLTATSTSTIGLPAPMGGRDRWARVPASFNRRLRTETTDLPLRLLSGALPDDLDGHVLFQSLSLLDSDAGFSGDALIWRVDLDGDSPTVTSRLLRTTDLLMAEAFADTQYRFESHGMMRMGLLGIQDQVNTALVGIDGNRVLATIDGGRSWEIDPASLRPISPVGRLDDYRPMIELPGINRFLCPFTITSAHPPYDPETGEFHGASLSIVPLPGMRYFEVLLWHGRGEMKRVPLVTPDGEPVMVTQSAHQMSVSRDWLVIADTAGTIEYGKLFDTPNSWNAGIAVPPRPDTTFFIVARNDLRTTTGAAVAHRVVIPRETGHFLVDYDNRPGRIVLHVPHTSASDFAEWVQPYDTHPGNGRPVRPELANCITPVNYDLGVIGRYEVDVVSGSVLDQHAFSDDWTWGTGGLTTANPRTTSSTVGDLYHANSGLPTDLAVQRVFTGFGDYPYRIVGLGDLPWDGVPTSIVRVDHDAGRVVDGWFYPGDRLGWTPTFIPRGGRATGSADGYLLTVVYGDDVPDETAGVELWVFDAARLSDGPVARLGHPDLHVPLALHSLWIDSLTIDRPDERVDVAAELTERAATWRFDPQVASVLRHEVLPRYDPA